MKKTLLTATFAILLVAAKAQTDSVNSNSTTPRKIDSKKVDLSNRSNDHFMLQYGFENWSGTPDSIETSGFSRFTNVYLMLDKPFKTNPRFSVGLGVGIGGSSIFFDKTYVNVKSLSTRLPFTNVDST